jgi:hypothetical protein
VGSLKVWSGFAALAAGVAVLVVALLPSGSKKLVPAKPSIAVSITPRTHVFGDPVRAKLELSLGAGANPKRISLHATFAPYRIARRTRELRNHELSYVFDLECLASKCAPLAPERQFRFSPAVLHYGGQTYAVLWPPVTVASRLTLAEIQRPRFRVDLHHVARRSSGLRPQLLGWSLAGGAALLVIAALGSFFLRRQPELAPATPVSLRQDEPSAVELALATVERALHGDEAGRRTALDGLAKVLDDEGLGELAARARALAWSAGAPGGMTVIELIHAVRTRARRAA